VAEKVVRLNNPPTPTRADPHAQIRWIFFQSEGGSSSSVIRQRRWAKERYIGYVVETQAGYSELEEDPRFFLTRYWESDALIRFNDWLSKQALASKTRYTLYKAVRQVMDLAYGLRIIDAMVYHAPMFKGVLETNQRMAYLPDEQDVLNAAIARWIGLAEKVVSGYTPTGNGIPYRVARPNIRANGVERDEANNSPVIDRDKDLTAGKATSLKRGDGFITLGGRSINCTIGGRKFYSVKELAGAYALRDNLVRARLLRGLTVKQAVGLEPHEQKGKSYVKVTLEGVTYPSIAEAVRVYKLDLEKVRGLLKERWSVEQAFGLIPRLVKQNDERAILWAFENQYDCNPALMMSEFLRRNLDRVCTLDRLRQLFVRWGVWPYIDDRLVMPLAAELAMLTGLNVESIKDLETDCFQEEHALTGKAVIFYKKKRSGSSSRPEEKELHLPLLEVQELYLEESKVERVRRLLGLVLAVTKSIRLQADDSIAKRLFIFQDVERSQKEQSTVIVAIDPHRKAGKWYRRFMRDENLPAILGSEFSFNLARLRPTFVTNMVLAGADMLKVQAVCGHATINATAEYLDQRQLTPAFHKTVSEALQAIVSRSATAFKEQGVPSTGQSGQVRNTTDFAETLSGCGCADPYKPSEDVRKITNHKIGTVCKFWNMCLFCDRAVITENSLPKLIVYQSRLSVALKSDAPSIRSRKDLFTDVVKMIDTIVSTEEIFPHEVVDNARIVAGSLEDVLVDQLVYQGL